MGLCLVPNMHMVIKSYPKSNGLVLMPNQMEEERGSHLAKDKIISLNYSFSIIVLFLLE